VQRKLATGYCRLHDATVITATHVVHILYGFYEYTHHNKKNTTFAASFNKIEMKKWQLSGINLVVLLQTNKG
jgi:hypothetical protein